MLGSPLFSVCWYVIEFDRHGSCIITDGQAGTQEAIDGQLLRDGKSSHDCKSLLSTQLDNRFQIWVSFSGALLLISRYNLHMISHQTQEVMSCNWWFQLYWMGNVGGFNAGACIGIIMALIGGLFRHSGSSWNSLVSSAHDHSFLFLVKARGSSCWGTTLTSLWHPAWTCICMPQMWIQLLWESEKKITL